jgi:hypothetical protein
MSVLDGGSTSLTVGGSPPENKLDSYPLDGYCAEDDGGTCSKPDPGIPWLVGKPNELGGNCEPPASEKVDPG